MLSFLKIFGCDRRNVDYVATPSSKATATSVPVTCKGEASEDANIAKKRTPLSISIREQLVDIHARAHAEGRKVKEAAVGGVGALGRISEEETHSDAGDQNRAVPTPSGLTLKGPRLQNIFASPLQLSANFVPPIHPKTTAQLDFIRSALADNFVFNTLLPGELKTLLDAFEHYSVPRIGTNIITQGEVGDYFYILEHGKVAFHVNDAHVGDAGPGQSFGELALLYNCPRAATCVTIESSCTLWRVDQQTFRKILASHTQAQEKETLDMLRRVPILADHLDSVYLAKLVDAVSIVTFVKDQVVLRKGDPGKTFYILKSGKIKISDIEVGGIKYDDQILETPGEYLGERALLTDEPRVGTAVAMQDDTVTLCIPTSEFVNVVGPYKQLALKSNDVKILKGIPTFSRSALSSKEMAELSSLIEDETLSNAGEIIYEAGHPVTGAIYIVRSGVIQLQDKSKKTTLISAGGYFGQETLFPMNSNAKVETNDHVIGSMTAIVKIAPVVVGKLSIASIHSIVLSLDRLYYEGHTATDAAQDVQVNFTCKLFSKTIPTSSGVVDRFVVHDVNELTRHRLLGRGTFGRVWLVTRSTTCNTKTPPDKSYALKVQYKRELLRHHQDAGVIREKQIMEILEHPFIIRLMSSFQDDNCVYMLLDLVQGGELYALMNDGKLLPERSHAAFYSACILEALGYMHRRSIVYRDLKPENILIGSDGFPVLVDLGFAKIVKEKTYTLCGTPLYLAPEVILNRGHDKACDFWSWAVLLFEMILGRTPFYRRGMDQLTLFKSIVQGKFTFYADERNNNIISLDAMDIISQTLIVKPAQRLGSTSGGDSNVKKHSFFTGLDFVKLLQKDVVPPWRPKVKNSLDTSAFDSWEAQEEDDRNVQKTLRPLTKEEQDKFAEFDRPLVVDDNVT